MTRRFLYSSRPGHARSPPGPRADVTNGRRRGGRWEAGGYVTAAPDRKLDPAPGGGSRRRAKAERAAHARGGPGGRVGLRCGPRLPGRALPPRRRWSRSSAAPPAAQPGRPPCVSSAHVRGPTGRPAGSRGVDTHAFTECKHGGRGFAVAPHGGALVCGLRLSRYPGVMPSRRLAAS
ncbi:hypothetical protein VULLAG_LOCUS16702 [Vulpes lagopus]